MKTIFFFFAISFLILTSCGKKSEETSPIRKDLTEMFFASGTLEPEEKYDLMAQTDGYLTVLKIHEGDFVKVGEVVAVIDNKANIATAENAQAQLQISQNFISESSPALAQIQANIAIANQKLQQDQIQLERYQRLYQTNSIAKLEFENAQLAYSNSKENVLALQKQYANTKQLAEQQYYAQKGVAAVNSISKNFNQLAILSAGKVYKKRKEVGDYVKKGDVIATIGNSSFIYAKLSIDETSIHKIHTGQKVLLRLNTEKEKNYEGEIFEISPSFDEQTQSFICKAKFIEPLDFTIIGTQLEANIVSDTLRNCLVIPRKYLLDNNFVKLKNKKELQKIKPGFVSTEWLQILDGITEKDVLVTDKIAQ